VVKSRIIYILEENLPEYRLDIKLVSEADGIHVIQKTIIKNLFDSDLVIVDISCLNPNVMFEFGLRFALDKPTLILKDSNTKAPFDVNSIEYVEFSRSMEDTEQFAEKLIEIIKGTIKKKTGLVTEFGMQELLKREVSSIGSSPINVGYAIHYDTFTEIKLAIAEYCIVNHMKYCYMNL
jgi:nucleoside 2-deoxyribosyltransferase